jgi:hypothetical protein
LKNLCLFLVLLLGNFCFASSDLVELKIPKVEREKMETILLKDYKEQNTISTILFLSGENRRNTEKRFFGNDQEENSEEVVICWPSGINHKVVSPNISQFNLVVEDAPKTVVGVAFFDANENGIKDVSEREIPNIDLQLTNNLMPFKYDEWGKFQLSIRENQFSISTRETSAWYIPSFIVYSFAPDQDTLSSDLRLFAEYSGYDLDVNFGKVNWRRGAVNSSYIACENKGSDDADNVLLEVQYSPSIILKSASLNYSIGPNNTYLFTLDTLRKGQTISISFQDSVSTNATLGEILNLSITASAENKSISKENALPSSLIEVIDVINLYQFLDSPKRNETIQSERESEWLIYTLRFENKGSTRANCLNITNQLSEFLDVNSFEFINASHEVGYYLNEQNALMLRFSGINLPTVAEDSTDADGFFRYRIKPVKTYSARSSIVNKAEIKFHYPNH